MIYCQIHKKIITVLIKPDEPPNNLHFYVVIQILIMKASEV